MIEEPATAPAVPGIDPVAVRAWLATALPDLGMHWLHAERLPGGKSNLTYRLHTGDADLVLRRPPLGNVLPTAHDMEREFRVLGALVDTEVPVSRPLAYCADETVTGAPFYVMEYVEGQTIRTLDDAGVLAPAQAAELSEHLAAMLAAIHRVDITALRASSFGRPKGFLSRQLARWRRQWEHSHTRDLPDLDRLVARLEARCPDAHDAALVHGDFRLDNTLVHIGPSVTIAAVVDWEMSTLGHPLADLGMTLTYWADRDDELRGHMSTIPPVTTIDGFYTTAEFAAAYARHSGRDLADLDFYVAFGCFKLAVILEGIHARHLSHNTVGEGFDDVGPAVPVLVERGLRRLAGGGAR